MHSMKQFPLNLKVIAIRKKFPHLNQRTAIYLPSTGDQESILICSSSKYELTKKQISNCNRINRLVLIDEDLDENHNCRNKCNFNYTRVFAEFLLTFFASLKGKVFWWIALVWNLHSCSANLPMLSFYQPGGVLVYRENRSMWTWAHLAAGK